MVNRNAIMWSAGLRLPPARFLAPNEGVTPVQRALDLDQARCYLVSDDSAASHGRGHGVEKQPCCERVAAIPVAIAHPGAHFCRKLLNQGQGGGEVLQRRHLRCMLAARIDVASAA